MYASYFLIRRFAEDKRSFTLNGFLFSSSCKGIANVKYNNFLTIFLFWMTQTNSLTRPSNAYGTGWLTLPLHVKNFRIISTVRRSTKADRYTYPWHLNIWILCLSIPILSATASTILSYFIFNDSSKMKPVSFGIFLSQKAISTLFIKSLPERKKSKTKSPKILIITLVLRNTWQEKSKSNTYLKYSLHFGKSAVEASSFWKTKISPSDNSSNTWNKRELSQISSYFGHHCRREALTAGHTFSKGSLKVVISCTMWALTSSYNSNLVVGGYPALSFNIGTSFSAKNNRHWLICRRSFIDQSYGLRSKSPQYLNTIDLEGPPQTMSSDVELLL